MKSYFITFRSITYAQRAEQLLRRSGLKCQLRRTPRWMEDRGCGYGVEVTTGELAEVLRSLKNQQVPWRRTWILHPGGEVEEVRHDLS